MGLLSGSPLGWEGSPSTAASAAARMWAGKGTAQLGSGGQCSIWGASSACGSKLDTLALVLAPASTSAPAPAQPAPSLIPTLTRSLCSLPQDGFISTPTELGEREPTLSHKSQARTAQPLRRNLQGGRKRLGLPTSNNKELQLEARVVCRAFLNESVHTAGTGAAGADVSPWVTAAHGRPPGHKEHIVVSAACGDRRLPSAWDIPANVPHTHHKGPLFSTPCPAKHQPKLGTGSARCCVPWKPCSKSAAWSTERYPHVESHLHTVSAPALSVWQSYCLRSVEIC